MVVHFCLCWAQRLEAQCTALTPIGLRAGYEEGRLIPEESPEANITIAIMFGVLAVGIESHPKADGGVPKEAHHLRGAATRVNCAHESGDVEILRHGRTFSLAVAMRERVAPVQAGFCKCCRRGLSTAGAHPWMDYKRFPGTCGCHCWRMTNAISVQTTREISFYTV